jgi:RHS repeat-associated protein
MNNASGCFNFPFAMTITRLFRLLGFLAALLAGVARVAGQGMESSLVYFSATGSYHANGAGSPDLYINDQSLSGGPLTFAVGGPESDSGVTFYGTAVDSMSISIQANNLSDYTITFVAQPGYQVFIDGVRKETVTSNDPASFSLTVAPLPSGPSAYVTGSTDQEPLGSASSITWGTPFVPNADVPAHSLTDWPHLLFNLGLAKNGQQLPPLLISLQGGAGLNVSLTANPVYAAAYAGVADVTCSVQGNTQVITAPQVIATLTLGPSGSSPFQLTFTRPNESTPFATYFFTPPADGVTWDPNNGGPGTVTVTKSIAGSSRVYETDFSDYNRTWYSMPWAYDDWHAQGQPVQRHVSLTDGTTASPTEIAIMQVTDGNGTVVTSTKFNYYDITLVQWVGFGGTGCTNGGGDVATNVAPLSDKIEGYGGPNTYDTHYYFTPTSGLQYGQALPDGLTTMAGLNVLQPTSTYRSWCNQSPTESDYINAVNISPNGSAETDYTYTNDWNGAAVLVGSARTSVSGTLLNQIANSYDFSQSANGQPLVVTAAAASVDASGSTLTTISKTYRPDTPDSTYSGLPYSVQKPDGTKVDYAYESGSYDGSQNFTPGAGGTDTRITTLYGVASGGTPTTNLPSGVQIDSIGLVANRSTETVDIRQDGLLARRETWVYDGSSFEQLSWQTFTYNDAGCQTSQQFSNGTSTSANFDGDLETSSTDVDGLTTSYAYDSMGRLTAITRAAVGSVPAQCTAYTYDGDNRITSTSIGPVGGEQLVTTKQYDTGGRLVSETSSSGVTTNYSYANGGQVVTESIAPGTPAAASQTTTNYADGRVQSITGNAVVNQSDTYDFDSAGRPRHTMTFGGSVTRTQATMTDFLGNTVEEDTGGFGSSGSKIVTQNNYNSLGQLARVHIALVPASIWQGPAQPLSADRLIQYDAFGAVAASGLDLNGNGSLDPGGTDRFTSTSTTLSKDANGVWWNVDTTQTYSTNNSSASNQVQSWIQLSGLGNGVISHTVNYDYFNNATTTTVQVKPGTQATVQTTVDPNGASTVQTTLDGLLTSVQTIDPAGTVQYSTTYAYDAQGRQVSTTDSRTGTAQTAYKSGTGLVSSATDNTGATVATYTYDSAGRVASVTDANGSVTATAYNTRGQVLEKSGSGTYLVTYAYDDLGQQTQQSTYRDGSTPDTTTWAYDANTGWLVAKTDASGQQVTFNYLYSPIEKQVIRTWARGVQTVSHYSLSTGDLTSVTYSDGTHAIAYTYNRDGTPNTVTDATGTRDFLYNNGQVTAEGLDRTWYNGLVETLIYQTASNATSVPGRYAGFDLGYATSGNADQEFSVAYGYDNLGRLGGVTANYRAQGTARAALSVPFTYQYANQSGLWNQLTQGSFNVGRTFETNRDVLTHISTNWNNTVLAHYAYSTNTAGQRMSSSQDGTAFADYGGTTGYTYQYDAVGELTNAVKSLGGNALPGAHFGYAYDAAGNRTTVSVDSESASYAANDLNQVTSRGTLKTRFSGTADPSASISAAGVAVARQGRYWDATPLAFGSNAQVNVSAILGSQSQSASLWAISRPASESLGYDTDGNLTGDSAWAYQYDAENHLVSMTTTGYAFAAPGAVQTITFAYDYLGRRARKTVTLNGTIVSDHKYVYHGWLLIADLNVQSSAFSVQRSYVWGLDASGTSLDGAGGVGGLVLETVETSSTLTPYGVAFDGNGNVAALVNTANNAFGAIYEYDPYGQLMHSEGAEAANNPFQFSTKYKDHETGLVYYGNRYYDPSLGRFINRDPSEEAGGLNLYGFVGNNSINDWDYLGLDDSSQDDPSQNNFLNPGGGDFTELNINDHDYTINDSSGEVYRNLIGPNSTYYVTDRVGNLSQVGLTSNDINNAISEYGTNSFEGNAGFMNDLAVPSYSFGEDGANTSNGFNSTINYQNFDPAYKAHLGVEYINQVKADNLRIEQEYDQKLAQIERVYGNVERANAEDPFAGFDELASFAEFGANLSLGFIGGVEAKLGEALTDYAIARAEQAAGTIDAAESDTALLQAHVDNAVTRLQAEGLTPGQKLALVDNPNLQSAFEGERIDYFFRQSVAEDPALSHLELTPRGQFGPDVFNPETQQWWDATTPGQWDAHAQKYWLFGDGTPLFTK